MGCLSKISFLFILLLVFLAVGIGVTKGLKYLAGETYGPGDTPHPWFMVAALDYSKPTPKGPSYALYPWDSLANIKKRIPAPGFRLPEPAGDFSDEKNNWHAEFTVLEETMEEQLVEVKRVDNDYETVGRYRVTGNEIITPLYFRRTTSGIALRGFMAGFVVAALASLPLRALLAMPEPEDGPGEEPG